MSRSANALIVMAKAPVAGEVKSRLAPPLSLEEAAELYRCLLLDLLENIASFEEADLYLAFAPADAAHLFGDLASPSFTCVPQRSGDLGERMAGIFKDSFEKGYRRVVVIGSDLPVFPSSFLRDAFRALAGSSDVVLGPSRDGGYYLIGLSRLVAEIFTGIPWGTARVLQATRDRLSPIGVEPLLLPGWFDIDTVEDLQSLKQMVSTGVQTRTSEMVKKLSILRDFPYRL
jgi:uncharacterized protein